MFILEPHITGVFVAVYRVNNMSIKWPEKK